MRVTELSANHVWKAAPGCRILVIDGGAVRFDIPRDWVILPRANTVLLFDQSPPDTRYSLGLSWHRTPLDMISVPLPYLLSEGVLTEMRRVLERSEIQRIERPPLQLAWIQLRVFDESDQLESCTRMCVARSGCTQAVILLEFRPEDEIPVFSVWQTLLSTLAVGDYIADPTTGRRREQRG
jgi:hypothetical protein